MTLEQLAMCLGRNANVRDTGRLLAALYPCRRDARRYVQGVYARNDGLLMQLDSRNWIDWNLLFRGDFEPHVGRLLRRLAVPGGVAVDIGANIGAHTLALAQAVGPQGKVLAFEPNPLTRSALQCNLALNALENVQVFDCALGGGPGVLPLKIPKPDSAEYSNLGLSSLVALDTPHDEVIVPVRSLDAVVEQLGLSRLDVVKIDVQGYECQVLAGMRETLARHTPAVVFEYESWAWEKAQTRLADASALFAAADYRLYRFGGEDRTVIEPLSGQGTPEHVELLACRADHPGLAER
jgi:FkbM family methyltransferase